MGTVQPYAAVWYGSPRELWQPGELYVENPAGLAGPSSCGSEPPTPRLCVCQSAVLWHCGRHHMVPLLVGAPLKPANWHGNNVGGHDEKEEALVYPCQPSSTVGATLHGCGMVRLHCGSLTCPERCSPTQSSACWVPVRVLLLHEATECGRGQVHSHGMECALSLQPCSQRRYRSIVQDAASRHLEYGYASTSAQTPCCNGIHSSAAICTLVLLPALPASASPCLQLLERILDRHPSCPPHHTHLTHT